MPSLETFVSATIFSIGNCNRYFSGLANTSMLIFRSLGLVNRMILNLNESAISRTRFAKYYTSHIDKDNLRDLDFDLTKLGH